MQTKKRWEARKHCALAKAEPKILTLPQTPFTGGAGRPKSNQLEVDTTFVYKPSLVMIDACNFELSDPHRPPATDRGDYNTLRLSLLRSV